jgi:DNA-binding transcriptional MocR family regulator
MFIWLTLPESLDSRELLRTSLASEGIIFVPGSSFFTNGDGARNIRLNYTKASEATIEDGMRRLGNLIARQLAEAAPTGIAAPVA